MTQFTECGCMNFQMLLGWSMNRECWGSTWMTITTMLMIGSRMVSLIHQSDFRICCLLVRILHFIDRSLVATTISDPCSKLKLEQSHKLIGSFRDPETCSLVLGQDIIISIHHVWNVHLLQLHQLHQTVVTQTNTLNSGGKINWYTSFTPPLWPT